MIEWMIVDRYKSLTGLRSNKCTNFLTKLCFFFCSLCFLRFEELIEVSVLSSSSSSTLFFFFSFSLVVWLYISSKGVVKLCHSEQHFFIITCLFIFKEWVFRKDGSMAVTLFHCSTICLIEAIWIRQWEIFDKYQEF